LRGEVQTVSAGAASGLSAIASAAEGIARGKHSAAVAGAWEFTTHQPTACIALLLLEPADRAPHFPTLEGARAGFSEAAPAQGGFLSVDPVLQFCLRLSEKSP